MNIKSKDGSISISGTDVKVGNDLSLTAKKDIDILDTNEKIFNEYFSNVEKNYKSATFNRKYSTIRGFYKFLLKNRYIEKRYINE